MTVVEITQFVVKPEQTEALLAARPGMLADFRADRAGFIRAQLVRLPEGHWLDLVWWRSAADFEASSAKGPNLPGIAAFFASIDSLVSSQQGTEADAVPIEP
jgi:hypothetical protein